MKVFSLLLSKFFWETSSFGLFKPFLLYGDPRNLTLKPLQLCSTPPPTSFFLFYPVTFSLWSCRLLRLSLSLLQKDEFSIRETELSFSPRSFSHVSDMSLFSDTYSPTKPFISFSILPKNRDMSFPPIFILGFFPSPPGSFISDTLVYTLFRGRFSFDRRDFKVFPCPDESISFRFSRWRKSTPLYSLFQSPTFFRVRDNVDGGDNPRFFRLFFTY